MVVRHQLTGWSSAVPPRRPAAPDAPPPPPPLGAAAAAAPRLSFRACAPPARRTSGQLLAVKLMKRPIPPLMGTNIMREIKIGAQLGRGHLNIVKPREVVLTRCVARAGTVPTHWRSC